MFLLDRPGQHDDFTSTLRNECKTPFRRAHAGHFSKHSSKPPHLNPQTRTVRFVDEPCSECPRQKYVSRHVFGPRFSERAYEGEQHRASCECDDIARMTHECPPRLTDR